MSAKFSYWVCTRVTETPSGDYCLRTRTCAVMAGEPGPQVTLVAAIALGYETIQVCERKEGWRFTTRTMRSQHREAVAWTRALSTAASDG